jgi:hypothetical protein
MEGEALSALDVKVAVALRAERADELSVRVNNPVAEGCYGY